MHAWRRCTLLGHDWGSMVAWFTAALHPEAVEQLIIMALPHPLSWRDNMDWNQRRRCCMPSRPCTTGP